MLLRVGPAVLEIMVALRRGTTGMTCHLVMMMMARALRLKVKATLLRVMLPKIAPTRSQLTSPRGVKGGIMFGL
jgi:hypothetical protein